MSRKKVYKDNFKELTENWVEKRDEEIKQKFLVKAKTPNQEKYIYSIETYSITIVMGESGTGKTLLACSKAIEMLLAGRIKRVIVTRPLLEVDEKLGFLPGDLNSKVFQYMVPVMEYFGDFLEKKDVQKLLKEERLQIVPLGLMRGRTFHDSFIVLDEGQNATYSQIKCLLTRLGKNSRMVLNGDVKQTDLHLKGKQQVPLQNVANRLHKKHEDINICYLTEEDVLRNELIKTIIKVL